MKKPLLICENLVKSFGNVLAIDRLSLQVNSGECLALVGPSGCGKTTLLRLLAGFEIPEQGSVWLNEQPLVLGNRFVPPEARRIGFVFQEYALFPHLTVGENIEFGIQKHPKDRRTEIVRQMLSLVNMPDTGARYPHELSGGERQRVALARALAPQPEILLLDEPFSNLDADRRAGIRSEVRRILKEQKMTSIFVTHDQEEAFYMGDHLAVMMEGTIRQVGKPENVFQQPVDKEIAEFLGGTEFLPGIVAGSGIQTPLGTLLQRVALPEGSQVEIGVRADDLNFQTENPHNAMIVERVYRGAYQVYRISLEGGQRLSVMQAHTRMIPEGERVRAYLDAGHDLAVFYEGRKVA